MSTARLPHPRLPLAALAAAAALVVVSVDQPDPLSVPAPRLTVPTAAGSSASAPALDAIAHCESRGDPTAVSPDGRYRGKYQFSRATWRSLGGKGDPAQAPEAEQDRLAAVLLKRQGPSAWPACSKA